MKPSTLRALEAAVAFVHDELPRLSDRFEPSGAIELDTDALATTQFDERALRRGLRDMANDVLEAIETTGGEEPA